MKIIFRLSIVALLVTWLPLEAEDVFLDATASSLKFTGHAFMDDFTGAATVFRGTAQIDRQAPQVVTSAKIVIGSANLTTFQNARDKNMRDWLEVKTNPEIVFMLQKVTPIKVDSDPAPYARDRNKELAHALFRAGRPHALSRYASRQGAGSWLARRNLVDRQRDDDH